MILNNQKFSINQRRYIGNKNKLMPWISQIMSDEVTGNSFFDVFAGTGSVTNFLLNDFNEFYINDFLYSNQIIFNAFFGKELFDLSKLEKIADEFNQIKSRKYDDFYFEQNYGGKFFSYHDAMIIGEIRERIELLNNINKHERAILITSLLYSADKIANTVGHYDAYRKNINIKDEFVYKLISPYTYEFLKNKKIHIYREDANYLVKNIFADVVFLDPPYNSRQYSRFYHVLEQITKWNKPKLFGVAMKPKAENMSDYSRHNAPLIFDNLIKNIKAKFIVVTYNNTYEDAKSSSSRNKITHLEILNSLNKRGKTKVFSKNYRYFNSGNTILNDHKEMLFITRVNKNA